jgi:hypothetical protein
MTKKSPDEIIKEWQPHINAIPELQLSLKHQQQEGGCKICAKAAEIFIAVNNILKETLENKTVYSADQETFANILDVYNEWYIVAIEATSCMGDAAHQQLVDSDAEPPKLCTAIKTKTKEIINKNLLN